MWDEAHFRQEEEVTVCSEIAVCANPAQTPPVRLLTFLNSFTARFTSALHWAAEEATLVTGRDSSSLPSLPELSQSLLMVPTLQGTCLSPRAGLVRGYYQTERPVKSLVKSFPVRASAFMVMHSQLHY